MTARSILLGLTAAVLLSTSASAAGPIGSIHVGPWIGGAYTEDSTGQFIGCRAASVYPNGFAVLVSIRSDGSWSLEFSRQTGVMKPGETMAIDLTFDGQAQFHVFGRAIADNAITVQMPNNSGLISQFRKSKSMTVFSEGKIVGFNLDGTSQLISSLANCVAVVNQRGPSQNTDYTVKESPKVAAAPEPAPARSSSSGAVKPDDGGQLRIEAIELATNFILKGLLQNPRVLTQAETPAWLASLGAAWRSDEASGIVRIVPPAAGMDGLNIAAAVVALDAKECKGKFASARTTELVDSAAVFRAFSSCEDSAGPRLVYYFIVPRKKGGFVLFSVGAILTTEEARGVTKDDRLVGLQKAALVSVNQ